MKPPQAGISTERVVEQSFAHFESKPRLILLELITLA
jgi:hypothetical protein